MILNFLCVRYHGKRLGCSGSEKSVDSWPERQMIQKGIKQQCKKKSVHLFTTFKHIRRHLVMNTQRVSIATPRLKSVNLEVLISILDCAKQGALEGTIKCHARQCVPLGPYIRNLWRLQVVRVEVYSKLRIGVELMVPPFFPQGIPGSIGVSIREQGQRGENETGFQGCEN